MTKIVDRPHDPRVGVLYNICGRCGGSGLVPFWNETTGQPGETWCGVCGGTGRDAHKDIIGPDHTFGIPAQRNFAGEVSSVKTQGRTRRR